MLGADAIARHKVGFLVPYRYPRIKRDWRYYWCFNKTSGYRIGLYRDNLLSVFTWNPPDQDTLHDLRLGV